MALLVSWSDIVLFCIARFCFWPSFGMALCIARVGNGYRPHVGMGMDLEISRKNQRPESMGVHSAGRRGDMYTSGL